MNFNILTHTFKSPRILTCFLSILIFAFKFTIFLEYEIEKPRYFILVFRSCYFSKNMVNLEEWHVLCIYKKIKPTIKRFLWRWKFHWHFFFIIIIIITFSHIFFRLIFFYKKNLHFFSLILLLFFHHNIFFI